MVHPAWGSPVPQALLVPLVSARGAHKNPSSEIPAANDLATPIPTATVHVLILTMHTPFRDAATLSLSLRSMVRRALTAPDTEFDLIPQCLQLHIGQMLYPNDKICALTHPDEFIQLYLKC